MKRIFYHIFKGLLTEQDDENSHDCVCHSVSHLKYKLGRPCRISEKPVQVCVLFKHDVWVKVFDSNCVEMGVEAVEMDLQYNKL